jgi:hypothetical protein
MLGATAESPLLEPPPPSVLILGALVAILIPPGEIRALRVLAIAGASLATVGEAVWIAATELSYHCPDDPPKLPLLRRVVRLIVPPYRPITPPDLVAAPAAPPPTPPDDAPWPAAKASSQQPAAKTAAAARKLRPRPSLLEVRQRTSTAARSSVRS